MVRAWSVRSKLTRKFALCLEQLKAFSDLMAGDEGINFVLTSPLSLAASKLSILEEIQNRLNFDQRVNNSSGFS
jgi:hypothetical protein